MSLKDLLLQTKQAIELTEQNKITELEQLKIDFDNFVLSQKTNIENFFNNYQGKITLCNQDIILNGLATESTVIDVFESIIYVPSTFTESFRILFKNNGNKVEVNYEKKYEKSSSSESLFEINFENDLLINVLLKKQIKNQLELVAIKSTLAILINLPVEILKNIN
jgi:hypothetical protein